MPIDFDFEGARKSGATDKDIAGYFKEKYSIDFDIEGAKKNGANDSDILDYLNTKYSEPVKKKEPSSNFYEVTSEAIGIKPKQLSQSPLKTAAITTPSVSTKSALEGIKGTSTPPTGVTKIKEDVLPSDGMPPDIQKPQPRLSAEEQQTSELAATKGYEGQETEGTQLDIILANQKTQNIPLEQQMTSKEMTEQLDLLMPSTQGVEANQAFDAIFKKEGRENELAGVNETEFKKFLSATGVADKYNKARMEYDMSDKERYALIQKFNQSIAGKSVQDLNIVKARLNSNPAFQEYQDLKDQAQILQDQWGAMGIDEQSAQIKSPEEIAQYNELIAQYNDLNQQADAIARESGITKDLQDFESFGSNYFSALLRSRFLIDNYPNILKEKKLQDKADAEYEDRRARFKKGDLSVLPTSAMYVGASAVNALNRNFYNSLASLIDNFGKLNDNTYSLGDWASKGLTELADNAIITPHKEFSKSGYNIDGYIVTKDKSGAISVFDKDFTPVQVDPNLAKKFNEEYDKKESTGAEKETMYDFFSLAPQLADQFVTMYSLVGGGRLAQVGLQSLTTKAISQNTGMTAASYLMTYEDYKKTGIENGLSDTDAHLFASISAMTTSLLEGISPNENLIPKGQVAKALEAFTASVGAPIKTRMKAVANALVVEPTKEIIQEITQIGGDILTETGANAVLGKDVFDAATDMDEIRNTAMLTYGTTALAQLPTAGLFDTKNKKEWWQWASKDVDKLMAQVQEDVKNGLYTEEKAQIIVEKAKAWAATQGKIPAGTEDVKRAQITPLLMEKVELLETSKDLDKVFQDKINKRIDAIDKEIVGIMNKPVSEFTTEVKETTTTDGKGRIEEPISAGTNVVEEGLGVANEPSGEGVTGEGVQAKEVLATEKPTPAKINVLGKSVNMYNNYIPSRIEDVESDAMYSFSSDSKDGIPSLLQDKAYANSLTVNGVKKENWNVSISGDELLKLFPKKATEAVPQAPLEEQKADIETRRQKELENNITLLNTVEQRRPNGSIGTQGFTEISFINLARFISDKLNLNIPIYDKTSKVSEITQIINYLKNNESAKQAILEYVKSDPIVADILPDDTYHFKDGNHRANLLNLIGVKQLPIISSEKNKEINAKYDAELAALDKQQVPEVVSEKVTEVTAPAIEVTPTAEKTVTAPKVSEALKDVDSTAKALEMIKNKIGESSDSWQEIADFAPEKSFGIVDGKDTGKKISDVISDAYHADKSKGKKTKLTKVVEKLLEESIAEAKTTTKPVAERIADLRAAEKAEYDAMANPKDKAKRKEIYDKYDKLITPLLEEQKAAEEKTSLSDKNKNIISQDEKQKLSQSTGDGRGRTRSGEITPLEGAPTIQGATGPNPQLVAVAEQYAKDNGIDLKRQGEYVEVDEERAKRIADAYEQMANEPQNPKVKEAYQNLIKQTKAQYEALVKAGYKFWFLDLNIPSNQNYAESPYNAMRDLRSNKEMGVFPTTDGFGTNEFDVKNNPLLEDTGIKWPVGGLEGKTKPVLANDLFRAVHDAFGHGLEGAGFRARGEENAWQAHSRLYTGSALGAITTETRGQNSWVNFGPKGEANRKASAEETVFADQKIGLMPEFTWTEGRASDMPAAKEPLKPKAKKSKPEQIGEGLLDLLGLAPVEPAKKAGKKKPVNVSNKSDLAELEDNAQGDRKTIVEAAKKAIATLKSVFPDMEIYIHEDPDSYNEQMDEVGGVQNSRGNFAFKRDANDNPTGRGRIDINLSNAKDTTVAHELTHAVLLKAFGDNPAVFKAFRDRMSKILRADLNKQVTEFEKLYAGQDVAPEEYLTELAALLSQGGETVKYKPRTLRRVAALINEFVSRITKGKIQPFKSEADFKNFVDFLNQVSGAISEGGVIEGATDKIKGTSSKTTSKSQLGGMPTSAKEILYSDKGVLGKPEKKTTNSSVANRLEEAARNYWGGQIVTSNDITEEQEDEIVENGVEEAVAALEASGKNAADWYSTAIEVAMKVAGVIHPELSSLDSANKYEVFAREKNPVAAAQIAMRMALAITSQNLNVDANTKYAEEQFDYFKKNGRFDYKKEYGAKAPAITSNMLLANVFVDAIGLNEFEKFIASEFTVSDLEKAASEAIGKKVKISGLRNDIINGAAIFGPKIGQGFLQNLMGNFNPVTIDLWMRRTWGRWTGDVVGDGITEARMAKFLNSYKDAVKDLGIKDKPDILLKHKPVQVLNKSGKLEYTMNDKFTQELESNPSYRKGLNEYIKEISLRANTLYKAIHDMPMSSKLLEEFVSGSKTYAQVANELIKNRSKLKEKYAEYSRFEKSNKRDPLKSNEWITNKEKSTGFTFHPSNEQISKRKPAWANAAKNIVADLNPIDIPTDKDRKVISRIVNKIREGMADKGYVVTNADVQAILWYPEKDIWAKLRGEEESNLKLSYDDQFIKIAKERGLGKQAENAAEQVRSERALRNSERNERKTNKVIREEAIGNEKGGTIKSKSQKAQNDKIKDFIAAKKKAGESDKDIRAGLELVADKLNLTTEDINDLMGVESDEAKPLKGFKPKEKPAKEAEGEKTGTRAFATKSVERAGVPIEDIPASLKNYRPTTVEEQQKIAEAFIRKHGINNTITELRLKDSGIDPKNKPVLASVLLKELYAEQSDTKDVAEIENIAKDVHNVLDAVLTAATEAAQFMAMMREFYNSNPYNYVAQVTRLIEKNINDPIIASVGKAVGSINKANKDAAGKAASNVVKEIVTPKITTAKANFERSKANLKALWKKSFNIGIAANQYEAAKNDIQFAKALTIMAKDFVVYQSVQFSEFLKEVASQIGLKESDIDQDHLRKIFEKAKSEKIQAGIKVGLKELELKLKDLIESHYSATEIEGKLIDKLKDEFGVDSNFGLNDAAIKELEAAIKREIKVLTAKEKIKALKAAGIKEQKDVNEILSLSEEGLLNDNAILETLGDKLGIKKLTPEEAAKLADLAKDIKESKEDRIKARNIQKFEDYKFVLAKKYKVQDFLISNYLTNIFGSLTSNEKNIAGNVSETILLVGELVGNALASGNPKDIQRALKALVEGNIRGFDFTKEVLTTGVASYKEPGDIKARNMWELIMDRENDLTRTERNLQMLFKIPYLGPTLLAERRFWNRALLSMDSLSGTTNNELGSLLAATREADKQKLRGAKRTKFIQEQMANSPEAQEEAREYAISAGYKPGTGKFNRAVQNYLVSKRPEAIKKAAAEYSARATLTQRPPDSTMTGAIANGLNDLITKNPNIKFFVPVVNTFANLIVKNIERSPFEFFSLAFDAGRAVAEVESAKAGLTKAEVARRMKTATVWTGIAVLLFALAGGTGDDKEEGFEIFGSGTGDPVVDKARKALGWKPNTVRFSKDGGYYNFEFLPFGFVLGMIGNMRDYFKFKKEPAFRLKQAKAKDIFGKNLDALTEDERAALDMELAIPGKYNLPEQERKEFANLSTQLALTPVNYSFQLLKSLGELVNAVGEGDAAINRVMKSITTIGRGIASPRYMGEVRDIFDNKLYDTKEFRNVLAANVPVVKLGNVLLDGFGREVEKYKSESIFSGIKYALTRGFYNPPTIKPLDQFLWENKIGIAPPAITPSMAYTEDFRRDYIVTRGKILMTNLTEALNNKEFEGLSPLEVLDVVNIYTTNANAEARDIIDEKLDKLK